MRTHRAFTLVELLVVISIVSMLASIVMVRISLAQASGRDAVRTQEVRQIDLATKLYVDTNKKAPLALTGCDIAAVTPTSLGAVSGCIAVSTAAVGTPEANAWVAFKSTLSQYIAVPDDPCIGTCLSASDFPIGYTYIAPLAMQYYCSLPGSDCVATSESYQVYAPMERQTVPMGNEGASDNYFAYSSAPHTVTTPGNLQVTFDLPIGGFYNIQFSWNSSVSSLSPGTITHYNVYKNSSFVTTTPTNSYSYSGNDLLWRPDIGYCWSVEAVDWTGMVSTQSASNCLVAQ